MILTTHDMQDIEALTQRILLIGKGRILLDGSLQQLKKRNSACKILSVEYNGQVPMCAYGMTQGKSMEGHGEYILDTEILSVSDAVAHIARQTEIRDISVTGTTAEEMVVSLYKEFEI